MMRKLLHRIFPGRFSSADYWQRRYAQGGNSGAGSYAHLAEFKAEVLNDFVQRHGVGSVIEFGSGDGNQLTLARYPHYVGVDVSRRAVEICTEKFAGDSTKRFVHLDDFRGEQAELALSLDVIFHLVEDGVYADYMARLFAAGTRFVGIYSSNKVDVQPAAHVHHRRFTDWVDANAGDWRLIEHVPNRFPDDGDHLSTSFAEFYFYERRD